MRTTSRRLAASLLAAGLLVLGACGGDDGDDDAADTTTTEAGATTSAPDDDDATTTTAADDEDGAEDATTTTAGDDGDEPDEGDEPDAGAEPGDDDAPDQGSAVPDEEATDVEWDLDATRYRGQDGRRVAYLCPPDGDPTQTVWGTDTYTDDSSVCAAAVHRGLINEVEGGRVIIEVAPGEEAYTGSAANGVTSQDYGAWSGSFTFPSWGKESAGPGSGPSEGAP